MPGLGAVVAILVLASSTSIMSTDMYSPSLPDLAKEFATSATLVKLTISLNFLAFGLAQLIHGPLSDRFGRRPVMLCSLLAVAICCLLCAFAQTITQLIIARILLGIAAAAEAVIGLAVLKDLYTEQRQMKAMALLNMVIAVTPALAPILGGYLHVSFGWQSNFYIIAGMALLAFFIVYRFLAESGQPDQQALKPSRVLGSYARLLRNSDFVVHCTMLGIALGLVFVFVTAAPFVLIDLYGVATEHFGYHQASIVVSFFIGSALASRWLESGSASRILQLGLGLIVSGAVLLIVFIALDWLNPITLVSAYSVMTFGMGPLFAIAPSRALRSVTAQTGSASALLSGIEQITAGLSAVAVSLLHDGTAKPMALVTAVLVLLLLCLTLIVKRLNGNRSSNTA